MQYHFIDRKARKLSDIPLVYYAKIISLRYALYVKLKKRPLYVAVDIKDIRVSKQPNNVKIY